MTTSPLRPVASTKLLARLVALPDLVRAVRSLPGPAFAALVRKIGVEDAGELVALATTPQILAAFDEDLFDNARPGERETFDSARFALWLEVLLEAGDHAAAARVAELSEDFVTHALSSLVLVLDHDALLARLSEGDDDAVYADKALESALSEELDGYLLLARRPEAWDASLALILALDRDHRPFLVRVLGRCADLASGYIDELDELSSALSAEESLAEDVEAEREERRCRQGYVEPRAARSFLALARQPLPLDLGETERDAVTRAYFRDLERPAARRPASAADSPGLLPALEAFSSEAASLPGPCAAPAEVEGAEPASATVFFEALRALSDRDPRAFGERMEELAYLANVLVAGAGTEYARVRPAEAAEAALATVALGTALFARQRASGENLGGDGTADWCEVLQSCPADRLFRKASSALFERKLRSAAQAFLRSRHELAAALDALRGLPSA